jgi:hypothetical protein
MIYYRVRKEYDQFPQNPKIRDGNILVAEELYTEREFNKLPYVYAGAFERIDIPKSQTYMFFGARFQKRESPWTKTPILKGGI